MLVTIGFENHARERELLRSMFEARKSVFIDLLRWDLPVLAGKFEIDQFDDRHATYLVLADDHHNHLASARLLPTLRPGILNSLFTDLCEGDLPSGPTTFEITRFCLARGLRATERRLVRNQLVTALARHAIDHEITTYTGVAEFAWLQQILSFGWRCMPLGPPQPHAGAMLGALRIDIGADTLDRLAGAGIFAEADHFAQAA
jgi:acyl-homoserine lactone synthase